MSDPNTPRATPDGDTELIRIARMTALAKGYLGIDDIHRLHDRAVTTEARQTIHGILVELYHSEEASVGTI